MCMQVVGISARAKIVYPAVEGGLGCFRGTMKRAESRRALLSGKIGDIVVTGKAKQIATARMILEIAKEKHASGDIEQAYILYKRFGELAFGLLEIAGLRTIEHVVDRAWLRKELDSTMQALEQIGRDIDDLDPVLQQPDSSSPASFTNASSSVQVAEDELARRMRALSGHSTGSLGKLSPPEDILHDELWQADESSAPSLSESSKPSPALPVPRKDVSLQSSVHAPGAIDFEAAFRLLRAEADTKANGVRYYPHFTPYVPPSAALTTQPQIKKSPTDLWSRRPKAMRPICMASGLIGTFLELAEPNTRSHPDGLETCGVLAGIINEDMIRFTTLIVPKQKGTSDTVTMTHEEELLKYCHSRGMDLAILGWIHTHPRQNCFMSSVDLHTHCSYQLMLNEAIAIVVAPKDPAKMVGVFHLTEPDGLQLIQRCTLKGFHAHPDNVTIYEDLIVKWTDSPFTVVDLRTMSI